MQWSSAQAPGGKLLNCSFECGKIQITQEPSDVEAAILYIYLHLNHSSPLLPALRAVLQSPTIITQLPNATFTLSIQPTLGLPRTRSTLTSSTPL